MAAVLMATRGGRRRVQLRDSRRSYASCAATEPLAITTMRLHVKVAKVRLDHILNILLALFFFLFIVVYQLQVRKII